jgi:hypothetical protein
MKLAVGLDLALAVTDRVVFCGSSMFKRENYHSLREGEEPIGETLG